MALEVSLQKNLPVSDLTRLQSIEPKIIALLAPTSTHSRELFWLTFHDEAPPLATVYNWFNEFKRGPTNLTDDLREGRPSTSTIQDNAGAVLMVGTGARVTYQHIRTSLAISMSQMINIVPEHLAVRLPVRATAQAPFSPSLAEA
ncbi:Putative uncharacterized protein FLJ37770 [Eumeta japonica]|uniref:Mos1 transposase HTH domain-containing protein n=1 Tax=Eumeta variegata TaxID=151549 RepID=A0A4C1WLX6_EUMVA|nr:Putative uncharacterized protein FLJ37770 [Eumeta japonica]